VSRPLIYPELAAEIGVPTGTRVPLRQVPPAVLAIRRRKGMVLDPTDPDTRSAGSFFTSAVVTEPAFRAAVASIGAEPPHWRRPDGLVKLNTSWLIERSGFTRRYGPGPVRISAKHALALTHRGGGSTAQLLAPATCIRDGVRERSGIELKPEPSLVNLRWS
jgi:UDP-N-acetylmuramate dehydrogenase